jgi:hypothetical protein
LIGVVDGKQYLNEQNIPSLFEVMTVPELLELFTAHASEQFCQEALMFWHSTGQYRELHEQSSSTESILSKAIDIYDTHLKPDSRYEINVDQPIRLAIGQAIRQATNNQTAPSPELFEHAEIAIISLLQNDTYLRFLNSERFQTYHKEKAEIIHIQRRLSAAKIAVCQQLNSTQPNAMQSNPIQPWCGH